MIALQVQDGAFELADEQLVVVAGAVAYSGKKDKLAVDFQERSLEELMEAGDVDARVHAVPFYDPEKQLPPGQYLAAPAAQ
mgnify:CR=1 FL=1